MTINCSWIKNKGSYFLLFFSIGFYSLSTVFGKYAANYPFFSRGFIIMYGLELMVLGVYAIIWQQVLKRFPLTTAYANRSFGIAWSFMWSVVLFQDTITLKKLLGVIVVLIGTLIVNKYE